MTVGILIPTRGDRPLFLEHAKYLLSKQTRQADFIEVVDDAPLSNQCDITYRYKTGLKRLFKKGCNVVLFWEDDDWYAETYIQAMLAMWQQAKTPAVFGLSDTTYYHIGQNKYTTMEHKNRSSAFCTLVGPAVMLQDLGKDNEPFFDLHLWQKKLTKKTVPNHGMLCMGIKHGVGKCGGKAHKKTFEYNNNDQDKEFLKLIVDEKSFQFYRKASS